MRGGEGVLKCHSVRGSQVRLGWKGQLLPELLVAVFFGGSGTYSGHCTGPVGRVYWSQSGLLNAPAMFATCKR